MYRRFPVCAVLVAVLVAVAGCSGAPASKPAAETSSTAQVSRVTGTVVYRERIALPADASLQVQLVDVTDRPAGQPAVVGQVTKPTEGRQIPLPYEIAFSPDSIDPTHSYEVRATITSGIEPIFVTKSPIPVITKGLPYDKVEIIVSQP